MITPVNKGCSLTNVANCFRLGAFSVLQGSALPGIQGDRRLMGETTGGEDHYETSGGLKEDALKVYLERPQFLVFSCLSPEG